MKALRYMTAVLAFVAVAPASAATLVGDAMDVSYRFPDVGTVYPFATPSVSPFVVGAGVESVVDVEDVTDIAVDFGAETLTITFNTVLSSPTWNSTTFNGLLFQGTGAARILGASVTSSTMAGFDNSRFYLSGGDFGLNWQGLSYVDGTQITADLTVAEVPEPSTWAMLLAGFGAIGALVRRRRRQFAFA